MMQTFKRRWRAMTIAMIMTAGLGACSPDAKKAAGTEDNSPSDAQKLVFVPATAAILRARIPGAHFKRQRSATDAAPPPSEDFAADGAWVGWNQGIDIVRNDGRWSIKSGGHDDAALCVNITKRDLIPLKKSREICRQVRLGDGDHLYMQDFISAGIVSSL